jgi:hypothetical protein
MTMIHVARFSGNIRVEIFANAVSVRLSAASKPASTSPHAPSAQAQFALLHPNRAPRDTLGPGPAAVGDFFKLDEGRACSRESRPIQVQTGACHGVGSVLGLSSFYSVLFRISGCAGYVQEPV